jgi:hypothetical protein
MGVKVFELAKDLGVDHRDVLKKCDTLKIRVRNYMSVLTDEQEKQLRGQFETGKEVIDAFKRPALYVGVDLLSRLRITPYVDLVSKFVRLYRAYRWLRPQR